MVLPVKGPMSSTFNSNKVGLGGSGVWWTDVKRKYTQAFPIDRPLPYYRSLSVTTMVRDSTLIRYSILNPASIADPNNSARTYASNVAYSKAYSKFVQKAIQGERIELGMNIATFKMTATSLQQLLARGRDFQLITDICIRLDKFATVLQAGVGKSKAERNRSRRRAARILGVKPTSDAEVRAIARSRLARDSLHAFSAEYLAFHYGWSPLIGDLYALAGLLSEGFTANEFPVEANSVSRYDASRIGGTTHGRVVGKVRVKLAAVGQISDKVVFLLNRLGLINPATVVWDKIPFSFVADWLGTFSQKLAAPTDFLGVNLKKTCLTQYTTFLVRHTDVRGLFELFTESYVVDRTTPPSPPVPRFVIKNPISGSWRRAIAQVSLLTLFGINKR